MAKVYIKNQGMCKKIINDKSFRLTTRFGKKPLDNQVVFIYNKVHKIFLEVL